MRTRIIRPDGQERVLRSRGDTQFDDDGNAVRIVGFEQDITEQVRADEELRRNEELLERTAELGRVGGWEHNLDDRRDPLVAAALRDPRPRAGLRAHDRQLERARPSRRSRRSRARTVIDAVSECRTWEFRRRIVRPDGEIRVVHGRGHVHCDEDGRPVASAASTRTSPSSSPPRRRGAGRATCSSGSPSSARSAAGRPTRRPGRSSGRRRCTGSTASRMTSRSRRRAGARCPTRARRATASRTTRDVIARGGSWDRRISIQRPDGEVRVLRAGGQSELGPDGQVVRVVGYAQDITDAVAAEEELRLAEERYRTLVERLPAVSYVAEAGVGRAWRYVSPQIERMLGYTPEEWLADPTLWSRCVHPDDHDRIGVEQPRHRDRRAAGDGVPAAGARRPRALGPRRGARPARGRRALPRRDAQRHHRAQAVRDPAPVPGRPRSADRPVQPAPLRRGGRARDQADPARGASRAPS